MKILPEHVKKNNIDINEFTTALEDAISITLKILNPYIGIRANAKNGKPITNVYHSEMQIVSIIAKIFKVKILIKISSPFLNSTLWLFLILKIKKAKVRMANKKMKILLASKSSGW